MKLRSTCPAVLLCLASLVWSTATAQDQKPLWEIGMGAFAMQLPAYRGSEQSINAVLPIPYVVYRGDFLKADRNGVRGVFFNSENAELNLSFAASPPVNSSDVTVRAGMPELDASLELGPSLDIKLWHTHRKDIQLRLFLPMRAAFTVESTPRFIGWQFGPRLNLDIEDPMGLRGWTLGNVAGPIFGSQAQHAYFYGVSPAYQTSTRPSYEAKGGYAGFQVLTALWKRFPEFWVGGFMRYDDLRGAVFEDSPLVTLKSRLSGGLVVAWILGKSSQLVDVE